MSPGSELETFGYMYIAVVCIMGAFTTLVSIIQEYETWSESTDMTTRTCTRNVLVKMLAGFAAAIVWPVLLLSVVVCRNPWRIRGYIARRLGRRSQGDSSIDVRQHVKISTQGKWGDRGWIVMLRTRHRKSLLRSSTGWGLGYKFGKRKGSTTARLPAVASVREARGHSASDVELAEMGRSVGWDFRRAVVTVVQIEEEGLFRNIVTYL
eukprot:g17653.t1